MTGDARARVLALLEEWGADARRALEGEHEDERALAEKEREIAPLVEARAEAGDVWGAVWSALWLGNARGLRHSRLYVRGARLSGEAGAVVEMWPDADRGRKLPEGGEKGALAKHGDYQAKQERAREAYRQARAAHPGRKKTVICRDIAGDVGYSERHLRKLVSDLP